MAKVEADRCYVYGGKVHLRKGANTLRVLMGGDVKKFRMNRSLAGH